MINPEQTITKFSAINGFFFFFFFCVCVYHREHKLTFFNKIPLLIKKIKFCYKKTISQKEIKKNQYTSLSIIKTLSWMHMKPLCVCRQQLLALEICKFPFPDSIPLTSQSEIDEKTLKRNQFSVSKTICFPTPHPPLPQREKGKREDTEALLHLWEPTNQ